MPNLVFRRAERSDLPTIIALLADDPLGSGRETATAEVALHYQSAFAHIDADPNQFLCVVQSGSRVIGTLQLTFIPGLSRNGALRGQIEAVRVARDRRGEGVGGAMMDWALQACRARGCALVQLTTDRSRQDAHRFYDRYGFAQSHLGYKLVL